MQIIENYKSNVFSIEEKERVDIVSGFHQERVDTTLISDGDSTKDRASINKMCTSIPTPFARLFLFRTVLGVVALFSFITALLFIKSKPSTKRRKFVIIVWVALSLLYFVGGTVINEMETLWVDKDTNQDLKREMQTLQGNQWAKYATGSVMAPMMFVVPFATLVDTDQQNQLVMHGGNYVRNFMGVFVLVALYSILFTKKNWRNFVLVGSFVIGYLGVVAFSGFSNSERFLLPGLPCLIIFWAYGIAVLDAKSYKWVKYWYVIVPVIEIGWAFFKIGSRGLL